MKPILSNYSSYFVKIFFLVFGFADFFGFLPNSLDLVDKLLTSIILLLFWLELKPSKFIFGKKNTFLDYSILLTFYILVIDTFVNFIRLINISDLFVVRTGELISSISFLHIGSIISSLFLFLHDSGNTSVISFYSVLVGFSLLILISLYSALKMTYGGKSVIRSFFHIFVKKESSWKNFADTVGSSVIVKFFLSFVVLFSIYQYFFSLIIQWFVVSLDKALLIFAIIYAVKDIKGTKSSVLNKIGSFDEMFLGFIKNIFTTKSKFFLGFSILLIFHFLSDLATFFIPYLFRFLSIDPFYLNYLGDPNSLVHMSVSSLISLESYSSFFNLILVNLSYIISTIGIIILLLLPLFFLYAFMADIKLKLLLDKFYIRMLVHFSFFSVLVFSIAPWVVQKIISVPGIQGVDFVTRQISSYISVPLIFLIFISLFLFAQLLTFFKSIRSRLSSYMILFLFLSGMIYFGVYVLNYFMSSIFYHSTIISYFFSLHNYFGVIIFSFMLFLEFLFYIGGFLLLTYQITSFIIKDIFVGLFSKKFVIFWTFLILLLPMFILLYSSIASIKFASVAISVLLIFSYKLYNFVGTSDKKDDYLLSLISVVALYQFLFILQLLFVNLGILSLGLFNFIQSFLLLVFSFGILFFFSHKIRLQHVSVKRFIFMILFGLGFGSLFFIIGEPVPVLFSNNLIVLLFFTLFIAVGEEILFRGVVYRLAKQSFSDKFALHIQAIVFSLLHFISLAFLFDHFSMQGSQLVVGLFTMVVYFVFLYLFSIVAAKSIKKKYNLFLPIVFHWTVNLVAILLFRLF